MHDIRIRMQHLAADRKTYKVGSLDITLFLTLTDPMTSGVTR